MEQRLCTGCGKPHPTPLHHTFDRYGNSLWWHQRCWQEQLIRWFGSDYIPNYYQREQPYA